MPGSPCPLQALAQLHSQGQSGVGLGTPLVAGPSPRHPRKPCRVVHGRPGLPGPSSLAPSWEERGQPPLTEEGGLPLLNVEDAAARRARGGREAALSQGRRRQRERPSRCSGPGSLWAGTSGSPRSCQAGDVAQEGWLGHDGPRPRTGSLGVQSPNACGPQFHVTGSLRGPGSDQATSTPAVRTSGWIWEPP